MIAFIGLFNIIGSISAGMLGGKLPQTLSALDRSISLRAIAITAFLLVPMTPASALIFGAAMGVLWLSTVPLTSGLVALMFGMRYMATLFGFVFFSPPGRRRSSACGSAATFTSAPGPTTWSGGLAWPLAFSPRW